MLKRILCPYHLEHTPSFVVYPNGSGHCFSCGAHTAAIIGIREQPIEKPKEDISVNMGYIDSLPKGIIRGVNLPYSRDFYYIVWPNKDYYKKRSFIESSSKYLSPIGHKKPLFIAKTYPTNDIIICEGELNAISLAECGLPTNIVSPGSAADFYSSNADNYLPYYTKFANILIVTDADKAGTVAAIELKTRLLKYTPHVSIHLWVEDANEVLTKYGKQALVNKYLEMCARLRSF